MPLVPRPSDVLTVVSDAFGIPVDILRGRNRSYCVSAARQVAMWLMHRRAGITLGRIAGTFLRDHSTAWYGVRRVDAVRKDDLQFGDRVIVRTRNSVYSLWSLGGDEFAVSGGWFDQNGPSPMKITVNGCTYGGSMIRYDVVAAPGLFLEFGNSVATTRIKEVRVERGSPDAPC